MGVRASVKSREDKFSVGPWFQKSVTLSWDPDQLLNAPVSLSATCLTTVLE